MSDPQTTDSRSGLAAAFGAYLIWGFLPLYLLLVREVPAFEFVAWRIVWTLPICLVIVAVRKQGADVAQALRNPRALGWLAVSAMLIAVNWVVYVWAIQQGNIFAASLGYYINPLVNVLLGTVFLGERLSRLQWVAVAVAAVGVSLLVRVLYHLYQGPMGAISVLGFGLILSLYYVRTQRLWPIVVAHILADVLAFAAASP